MAVRAVRQRPQPDWKAMHEQLRQHRHLTLQLLWEEYQQAHPEGYRYSWFCQRYQHWRRHLDVVLRQEHKAGEKMFVDWAGQRFPSVTPRRGKRGRHRCLFLWWEPVPTPTRKRLAISKWKPGSRRTSTRWNFTTEHRLWRCPITPRQRSPEPVATTRIPSHRLKAAQNHPEFPDPP